jgi:hypothetical protein
VVRVRKWIWSLLLLLLLEDSGGRRVGMKGKWVILKEREKEEIIQFK